MQVADSGGSGGPGVTDSILNAIDGGVDPISAVVNGIRAGFLSLLSAAGGTFESDGNGVWHVP